MVCRLPDALLSRSHYRTLLRVKDPEVRNRHDKKAAEKKINQKLIFYILNHNLTVITLMIAAVRSAVMAAKRVWRIFLTRIQPKYIAIA